MTTLTQPSERHPVVLRRGVVGFIETEVHLLSPAKYVEVECRERYPTRLSREYVCWLYASTVIALLSRSVESLSWVVGSERGEGTNSANAGYLRMILFITACEPAVWLTNHVASRGIPVIVIGHAKQVATSVSTPRYARSPVLTMISDASNHCIFQSAATGQSHLLFLRGFLVTRGISLSIPQTVRHNRYHHGTCRIS